MMRLPCLLNKGVSHNYPQQRNEVERSPKGASVVVAKLCDVRAR